MLAPMLGVHSFSVQHLSDPTSDGWKGLRTAVQPPRLTDSHAGVRNGENGDLFIPEKGALLQTGETQVPFLV